MNEPQHPTPETSESTEKKVDVKAPMEADSQHLVVVEDPDAPIPMIDTSIEWALDEAAMADREQHLFRFPVFGIPITFTSQPGLMHLNPLSVQADTPAGAMLALMNICADDKNQNLLSNAMYARQATAKPDHLVEVWEEICRTRFPDVAAQTLGSRSKDTAPVASDRDVVAREDPGSDRL